MRDTNAYEKIFCGSVSAIREILLTSNYFQTAVFNYYLSYYKEYSVFYATIVMQLRKVFLAVVVMCDTCCKSLFACGKLEIENFHKIKL